MRTFISRRNVNLAVFTTVLVVDWIAGGGQRVAEVDAFGLLQRVDQHLCVRNAISGNRLRAEEGRVEPPAGRDGVPPAT